MSHRKIILTTSFILVFIAGITPRSTSADDLNLETLNAQLLAFGNRLDALEAANSELKQENQRLKQMNQETMEKVTQAESSASSSSWADRISIKGDFRQRYENIDEEGKPEINQNRIRARALINARVGDDFELGLGFASGGDDPVSTNQTLGGAGSTKSINMDLAYFKWNGLQNTTVYGGKFKNFLFKPGKHDMLWDGDWNPEGLGLAWNNGDQFVNLMGTWLESDSNKGTEFSYALQAGFKKEIGDHIKLTAGIGYYFLGTKGKGTFFGDADDFFGNSFDPVSITYLYDYEELELFADLGFRLNGRPASVFFDYIQNQAAGQFDTGYAAGFKYGSAKSEGEWEFAYIYQNLEADAAYGLLVNSDFAGGGTDGRGHILKGGFAIAKNVKASITYQIAQRNGNLGSERDYDRLQLDLALKY